LEREREREVEGEREREVEQGGSERGTPEIRGG
jgi:hypothetical protein